MIDISLEDLMKLDGVQFTKKSGGNLFALCPFHDEKTPSFSLNPEKNAHHCFGCNKSGGYKHWLADYKGMSEEEFKAWFREHESGKLPAPLKPSKSKTFRADLPPDRIATHKYLDRDGRLLPQA